MKTDRGKSRLHHTLKDVGGGEAGGGETQRVEALIFRILSSTFPILLSGLLKLLSVFFKNCLDDSLGTYVEPCARHTWSNPEYRKHPALATITEQWREAKLPRDLSHVPALTIGIS